MADLSKTYYGNTASRGNLSFKIGVLLEATKSYQNGVEGYTVKVQRFMYNSMSTGGVSVSGNVNNGTTSVTAGNSGYTTVTNTWYAAGSTINISSCYVTVRLNSISATSTFGGTTYSLPEPTYAPLTSITGSEMVRGTNNVFTFKWTPSSSTQTFEYGIKYGDVVLVSEANFSPMETTEQIKTLSVSNDTLAELTPDSTSLSLTAYLTTENSATDTKVFTIHHSENSNYGIEMASIVSCISSHANNSYEDFRGFYNGYSIATITLGNISLYAGATISSTVVSLVNNTNLNRVLSSSDISSGSFTLGPFLTSGTDTITVTATDSRGYISSKSVEVIIQPYSPINISGFYADRCTDSGEDDVSGTSSHPHGVIANKDNKTIGYDVRLSSSENNTLIQQKTGRLTIAPSSDLSTITALILGSGLDTELNYNYQITLTDGVATPYNNSYRIQGSYSIMEVHNSKRGISFLGAPAEAGRFNIGTDPNNIWVKNLIGALEPDYISLSDMAQQLVANVIQEYVSQFETIISGLSSQVQNIGGDVDDLVVDVNMLKNAPKVKPWAQLGVRDAGGNSTITINGLSTDYTEFMIVCGVSGTSKRNLASTTISADRFLGYTSDHGNGTHQAYYSSTYSSGASYLGDDRVKLYASSSGYCIFYGR